MPLADLLNPATRTAAFTQIVNDNLPLIHAAAHRQCPAQADDITQATFLVLLQKAHTLRESTILPAWLLTVTHNICKDARKRAARRHKHEQKAAAMKPTATTLEPPTENPATLTPHLDAALASLPELDRAAILLRYLHPTGESTPIAPIAAQLHLSEESAKKRLQRALQKLRHHLHRRGLHFANLPLALAWQTHHAPPLPSALAAATLQSLTIPHPSTVSLAQGAFRTMFWTNAKIAALVAITAAAAFATVLVAQQHPAPAPTPTPSPFSVTLDGATLQLVAAGSGEKETSAAWQPDGSPLPNPDLTWTVGNGDRPTLRHLRINLDPTTDIAPSFRLGDCNVPSITWFPTPAQDADPAHNQWDIFFHAPPTQKNLDARLLIATGPWAERMTLPSNGGGSTLIDDHGHRTGVIISQAIQTNRDTLIIISDGRGGQDYRLIATDRTGATHDAKILPEGGGNDHDLVQISATFSHLRAADITKLEYDTRPYDQFVNIKNIALDPGMLTQVEIHSGKIPSAAPNTQPVASQSAHTLNAR